MRLTVHSCCTVRQSRRLRHRPTTSALVAVPPAVIGLGERGVECSVTPADLSQARRETL